MKLIVYPLTLILLVIVSTNCSVLRMAKIPTNLTMDSPNFNPRIKDTEKITLKIIGEPRQPFRGFMKVDGSTTEIEGQTPADYSFEGLVFIGDFRKLNDEGMLSFQIVSEKGIFNAGTLNRSQNWCRFGYHDREIEVLTSTSN